MRRELLNMSIKRLMSVLLLPNVVFAILDHSVEDVTVDGAETVSEFANPFIGTGGDGNCFPGATQPFGMFQGTPVNQRSSMSGYKAISAGRLFGMSQTALSGTGIGDALDILILPILSTNSSIQQQYTRNKLLANVDKNREEASPGYYKTVVINKENWKTDHLLIDKRKETSQRTAFIQGVQNSSTNISTPIQQTVSIEVTSTKRSGLYKFQWDSLPSQKGPPPIQLLVDVESSLAGWVTPARHSSIRVTSPFTIEGSRCSEGWGKHCVYWVMKVSRPVTEWIPHVDKFRGRAAMFKLLRGSGLPSYPQRNNQSWSSGMKYAASKARIVTLVFNPKFEKNIYDTKKNEFVLYTRLGLSYTSCQNAWENIHQVSNTSLINPFDFENSRKYAANEWENILNSIEVVRILSKVRDEKKANINDSTQTVNIDGLEQFYSALYHVFAGPSLYSDVDGTYKSADGSVRTTKRNSNNDDKTAHDQTWDYYGTFSLWDTYRSTHPLFTIISSNIVPSFIRSLVAFSREGPTGTLPRWLLYNYETWTMIGYPAVPVIADALLKGIAGLDDARMNKDDPLKSDVQSDMNDNDVKSSSANYLTSHQVMNILHDTATQKPNTSSHQWHQSGIEFVRELTFIPAKMTKRKEKDEKVENSNDSRFINESVSKALEYTTADWCIAQVAKKMYLHEIKKSKDKTIESNQNVKLKLKYQKMYSYFSQRADLWKLYIDPTSKLMRPRRSTGEFLGGEAWDPAVADGKDYTESNALQYSFHVLHDIEGLIEETGGFDSFEQRLDYLFSPPAAPHGKRHTPNINGNSSAPEDPWDETDEVGLIGGYAHGNEPGHHIPYLYNYINKPWKTQEKVHTILTKLYWNASTGLPGNDDYGAMSAWYVFSCLGFYPVNPCGGRYQIGRPMVYKATIRISKTKKFFITVHNQSLLNKYIQKVKLNNKTLHRTYVCYPLPFQIYNFFSYEISYLTISNV